MFFKAHWITWSRFLGFSHSIQGHHFFLIIGSLQGDWPQGPSRSGSRCGTGGLGQYKTHGLVLHFQKCLWRPGGSFFQIGLDCVMSHHHIEGLCTFLFKFWQENSKWCSCQMLETILCKFGWICATGNAFVRLIVGRKIHIFFGSRSERWGARRAPTKRVWCNTVMVTFFQG